MPYTVYTAYCRPCCLVINYNYYLNFSEKITHCFQKKFIHTNSRYMFFFLHIFTRWHRLRTNSHKLLSFQSNIDDNDGDLQWNNCFSFYIVCLHLLVRCIHSDIFIYVVLCLFNSIPYCFCCRRFCVWYNFIYLFLFLLAIIHPNLCSQLWPEVFISC